MNSGEKRSRIDLVGSARLERRDRCVIKRQLIEADRITEVNQRMQHVLERAHGFVHPQLVLPNESLTANGNELLTVSRFIPGLPLNELLVRLEGVFRLRSYSEIGRQLLDGLSRSSCKVARSWRCANVRTCD